MGAYSNPEIIVDTQSGQHWRDLQESINATSRQMTNAFVTRAAENKKKNETIALQVGEEESAMNRFVGDTQIKNPTVDFEDLYRPMIKEYAKLKTNILNGTSANPSEDRKTSDQIFGTVKNIQETMIDISSAEFPDAFKKMNSPGGLDGSANQPDVVDGMAIFHGLKSGKKVPVIDENYQISWDIYDANNKLVKRFTSQEIKDSSKNGMLFIVPNAAENVDSFKIANPAIFEQKEGQPTGIITSAYLDDPIEYKMQDKSVQDTLTYTKKTALYGMKQIVNKARIAEDTNFNTMVESKAAGMTNSTFSGREAILFNNNYFKDQPGAVYYDPTQSLTEEQKIKFKDDYKKFVLDGLPNEQVVPGYKPVEKEEIVDVKPKPTKVSTTKPKDGKPAKTEGNIDEISKEIYAIDKNSGPRKFSYGGNVVTYDTSTQEFRITDSRGPKDAVFKSKAEVVKYLKDGAKPKLGVKSK